MLDEINELKQLITALKEKPLRESVPNFKSLTEEMGDKIEEISNLYLPHCQDY